MSEPSTRPIVVQPGAGLLPLVVELRPAPEPVDVWRRLASLPHVMFLDSALAHAELGRCSFVTADPFAWLQSDADSDDGLAKLAAALRPFRAASVSELPPFQGGAAGLLSYDLGRQFERLPAPRFDEFPIPRLACGLYDVVVAFDLQAERAWLISHGFPETDPQRRMRRAEMRLADFARYLSVGDASGFPESSDVCRLSPTLAPQFPTGRDSELTSTFSRDGFERLVERGIEYVLAGDVFQVNLAQRLLMPARSTPWELYARLRAENPATFAGYFDLGRCRVASASPERLVRCRERQVEARPIKGTRPRHGWPEADLYAALELSASDKDRAENVMIVDLLRNDLSRACEPHSVRVDRLCQLETYEFVQHLVSVIHAELREDADPVDLLRAVYPGGSVTGAPKVRAMELIAELEPTARGAYCGSAIYLGFDGALDANLLIRTITDCDGWWQAPVGGGITALSDPRTEYEETWHKAEGLLRAMLG